MLSSPPHDGGFSGRRYYRTGRWVEVSTKAVNSLNSSQGGGLLLYPLSQPPTWRREGGEKKPAPDNINLACYYRQWWKTTLQQSLT